MPDRHGAAAEFEQARHDGAVAEALGSFFDAEGKRIRTELHDGLIGIDLQENKGAEVLAIAGGTSNTWRCLPRLAPVGLCYRIRKCYNIYSHDTDGFRIPSCIKASYLSNITDP